MTTPKQGPLIIVVGNRPQFIKLAPITAELQRRQWPFVLIHTGQHHDPSLSDVFFTELSIPKPDVHLGVGSGLHGAQTAAMLVALEAEFIERNPYAVLLFGDTNSTMAAALAAVKLHIPVIHVEAGPRIYDMTSPEEVNRVFTDHISALRFCPDADSVANLAKENITEGVINTGDAMLDCFEYALPLAQNAPQLTESPLSTHNQLFPNADQPFALLTVHRPNNTDSPDALKALVDVLERSPLPVVFPVHPRTRNALEKAGLWSSLLNCVNVTLYPALGYLDVLRVMTQADIVVTDSGGLQKEAYFAGKPVLTAYTTPWPAIESAGWQRSIWSEDRIDVALACDLIASYRPSGMRPELFGTSGAARRMIDAITHQPWCPHQLKSVVR